MTTGLKTVIYPVKDLAQARTVFGKLLGVDPIMDQPYYVGFKVQDQDVGLDPNGHAQGMTGPIGYWHVDDIEATLRDLLEAGAQAQRPVSDVGGGKLVATVTDGAGNVIGLLQNP